MSALFWLRVNWRLTLELLLVAAIGVLSYQLQGARSEVQLLTLQKQERDKRDALRASANVKNKERTDEDYAAARQRAARSSVRAQPASRAVAAKPAALGGDGTTACFSREQLDRELTGVAQRAAARLNEVIAGVLRRDAERLAAIAQQSEGVAAAYRACRAYTLNMVQNAPGEGGGVFVVGGDVGIPNLARSALGGPLHYARQELE